MRRVLLPVLIASAGCGGIDFFEVDDGELFADLAQCTSLGTRDAGRVLAALLNVVEGNGSNVSVPVAFFSGNPPWLDDGGNTGTIRGTAEGDPRGDGLQVGETVVLDVDVDAPQWSGAANLTFLRLADGRLQVTGAIRVGAPDCNYSTSGIDVIVDPDRADGLLRPEGELDFSTFRGGATSRLAIFVPGSGGVTTVRGALQFDGSPVASASGTFKGEPTAFTVSHEWRR